MKRSIIISLLVACGGNASDDTINPDASVNPPPSDAVVLVDAPPSQAGLVEVALDCQPYAREVHHVATDNSRDVTINSYAITALASGDRFILSRCDAPVAPTCNGGDVCTGELAPSAEKACTVTSGGIGTGGDLFLDGRLVVLCGTRTERYSSSGTLTATTQTTFTVKLEVFQ